MKAVLSVLAIVATFTTIQCDPEVLSCDVVPIEVWSGELSGYTDKLKTPVELVIVTHTITPSCETDESCERLARSIRNAQKKQGYDDIRLSFLVGNNGKIYEGAGWNVGSHTAGYNSKAISLSFMGDYTNEIPSQAALDAAEQFLGCYLLTHYLGCEYELVGHRQVSKTTSPGNALQSLIETWAHWTRHVQKP